MTRSFVPTIALLAIAVCTVVSVRAQTAPPPAPPPLAPVTPTPMPGVSPGPMESPSIAPTPLTSTTPAPSASATPTPVPSQITANPQNVQVPVGSTQTVQLSGVFGQFTAVASDPSVVELNLNQENEQLTISGKKPGAASITITDQHNTSASVGVRVAYNAGDILRNISVRVTGNPATPDFVRDLVQREIARYTHVLPGAQVVVSTDDVPVHQSISEDDSRTFDVPVLLQGNNYFSVNGTTRVTVENVALPRISPDQLMVSDFPERLTENGILFTADVLRNVPSRFLYFHYNPNGEHDRRIVLVAENHGAEPATVQFIDGRGGPTANEMEVGHAATKAFLANVVQNQGRIMVVPANHTMTLTMQDLPAGSIVANLLQLRLLNGPDVHLTLVAQDASDNPDNALVTGQLLTSTVKHARGIYSIPEFHFATQWNVDGEYLELPVGQIPLPNTLAGEALAGDYGVLESFVVNVQNPMSSPQRIAIYENPRGGGATGTYIIDGTLIQSHRAPAFSRYKVRQYVVPARGFVRVTITTIPEAGSSYPLRLVFAPDDGSVAPGAPGSPVY